MIQIIKPDFQSLLLPMGNNLSAMCTSELGTNLTENQKQKGDTEGVSLSKIILLPGIHSKDQKEYALNIP